MRKVVYLLAGFSGFTTALTFLFYHTHLSGANILDGIALISLS